MHQAGEVHEELFKTFCIGFPASTHTRRQGYGTRPELRVAQHAELDGDNAAAKIQRCFKRFQVRERGADTGGWARWCDLEESKCPR